MGWFWSKVMKAGPNECWVWVAARHRQGYGTFSRTGFPERKAHRASWVIHFGVIPAGMCVLHRCDNPPCVNPAHLFLGTQQTNIQDMDAKGRRRVGHQKGEDHPMARLDVRTVLAIRSAHGSCSTLAEQFSCSRMTISRIRNRKLWRHI